jgi:MFS family permease
MSESSRRSGEDSAHGWRVAGTLAVTVTVSYGVLTYTFGVVLVPMQRELGWSRVELTGAFSLALAVWALAGIGVGVALDRYPPRVLLACGSALAAGLVLAWSQVHDRVQLYVVFAGLGVAMAAVLYNAVFAVVTKWFRLRRRQALTAITLVGAASSFIFSPLAADLTVNFGWREALVILAVLLAVVTVPLHAAVLRQPPVASEPVGDPGRGGEARAAFASPRFWLLTAALALGSYTWSAMVVQLVPFLSDSGHSLQFGAFAAGVVGLGQLPGRLVFVLFGRALGGSRLPTATFGLAAAALAVLLLNRSEPAVFVFAAVFGMSAGMTTLMTASVPAELFGRPAYGAVSGVIYGFSNGARALAPLTSTGIALLPGAYATLLGSLVAINALAAWLGFLALARRDGQPGAANI